MTGGQFEPDLRGVTVGHVGHFDASYSRNRIVAKALRRAGADVVEISDQGRFPARAPTLVRGMRRNRLDVVVVGFPGHADVALARIAGIARRVPIVFDPLVSLYETAVEDRATVRPGSAKAVRYLWEDRLALRLADLVLLDTHAHMSYFADRLEVPIAKLRRIWVGADDEVMYPRDQSDREHGAGFRAVFYGNFIPLHGIEHIVRAAHRLEMAGADVSFKIVGQGQTFEPVRRLAESLGVRSVEFAGLKPYEELPAMMADSDVCLGIFGTSGKASRVIPNKVFDALAMGRPVLTADTPAVREALTHGVDAWLCPAGDPDALAEAITMLRGDAALLARLGAAGHELFRRRFSVDALARELALVLAPVVAG